MPQVLVRIEATIVWTFAIDPQSDEWVGACPVLNLNAIGETWEEVNSVASEAMRALFEDLFQSGELEAFLRELGWHVPPLPTPGSRPRFDVPFTANRERMERLLHAVG